MASRSWCFTVNNPDTTLSFDSAQEVRYAIWQMEEGESGTRHLQGYIELKKPMRMRAVKALSTVLAGAHLETRKGTREQARDYCRKPDTRVDGPWEFGDWEAGGAGKRNDISGLKRLIDTGASDKQVADEYFGLFLKYQKGIQAYKRLCTATRAWKTQVWILVGTPGSGKTLFASSTCPAAFWKQPGSKWWDGYDGHEDVVLDEFTGWIPYRDLLRVMDAYPLDVETKGGQASFVAKRLLITSNRMPSQWYSSEVVSGDLMALVRRIDRFYFFATDTGKPVSMGGKPGHVWTTSYDDFLEMSAMMTFN